MSVVKRIKKLLALSGSDNQHESERALQFAMRLMARHDIESADIEKDTLYKIIIVDSFKRIPVEATPICNLIYDYFGVFTVVGPGEVVGNDLKFVGAEHRVEIAKYVYDYLSFLFKDMARKNGIRHRKSYFYGLARGIEDKLKEARDSINGMSCGGFQIVERAAASAGVWYSENISKFRTRGYTTISSGENNYELGEAQGKKIRLNPGIKNSVKTTGLLER